MRRLIALCLLITLCCCTCPPTVTARAEGGVKLPVIMYHNVVTERARLSRDVILPEMFVSDMDYLSARGYTTVSIADILAYVDEGVPLPEKPVLVTFDDGHLGVMEYLLPMMRERNLKAVMNVEGFFSERSTKEDMHNPTWSYLTWDEIAQLANSGQFEIGNHTYDMHSFTPRSGCRIKYGESAQAYAAALNADLTQLQDRLIEAGVPAPNTFAYPFGYICDESQQPLQDMGFRVLQTCYEKVNDLDDFAPGETFRLHRCNRSGLESTEAFMKKLLKGLD